MASVCFHSSICRPSHANWCTIRHHRLRYGSDPFTQTGRKVLEERRLGCSAHEPQNVMRYDPKTAPAPTLFPSCGRDLRDHPTDCERPRSGRHADRNLSRVVRGKPDRYPNLTVKKIPKAVPARCEWGKDDYSLQVDNLPKAPLPLGLQALELDMAEGKPVR